MPNVEYRELKFAICTQDHFRVSRGTFHSDKFHPAAGEVVILDVYQDEAIFHSSFSLRLSPCRCSVIRKGTDARKPDQTRSRIIAIPWPTPMHMVHKA